MEVVEEEEESPSPSVSAAAAPPLRLAACARPSAYTAASDAYAKLARWDSRAAARPNRSTSAEPSAAAAWSAHSKARSERPASGAIWRSIHSLAATAVPSATLAGSSRRETHATTAEALWLPRALYGRPRPSDASNHSTVG